MGPPANVSFKGVEESNILIWLERNAIEDKKKAYFQLDIVFNYLTLIKIKCIFSGLVFIKRIYFIL